VLGGVTLVAGYRSIRGILERYYANFGRNLAKTVAAFIDGDSIDRYLSTLVTDQQYEDTLRLMRVFQEKNDLLYLYAIKMSSTTMTCFIYDSDENDPLPLGYLDPWQEDYIEYGEKMFRGEEVEPIISNGPYGWIMTIYEPIYGSGGAVRGYVGLDFSMDRLAAEYLFYLLYLGIVVVLIIAAFSVLYFVFIQKTVIVPLNTMTNAAGEFLASSGNGQSSIAALDISTNDELQSLMEALQFMEQKINRTIEELVKAEETAQAASRSKSAFLANTSHEIRTPMNAIIGMSELILREQISPEVYEYTVGIKQAGANLLSIINNILDLSRIESGKFQLTVSHYHFAPLINNVINVMRVRFCEKPILFLADIDARIPNELIGDEVHIRQILFNVLSNAVKYTQKGFVRFTVRGTLMDIHKVILEFKVADTGIGIREEDMPKLFGSFTRLDSQRTRDIEGTGLGLAITKSICSEMGGDITISSEYGKGSTFTVLIPQGYSGDTELAAVENPSTKGVILYDERPLYADSVSATLKNLGVAVTRLDIPNRFLQELETGRYPFAFVSAGLVEQAAAAVNRLQLSTRLTLLATLEETLSFQGIPVLLMPAYAVPVANLLNGLSENQNGMKSSVAFTAPDVRVLIVDDIMTNLKVAQGLLTAYQMQVDICDNGGASIEMIKARHYDLVFMDHMMPGMDGIEVLTRIRALGEEYFKQVPIIALTANALAGMQEMFLSKGFNDYLAKPIEITKLNSLMNKWIPWEKRRPVDTPESADQAAQTEMGNLSSIEGLNVEKGIAMSGGVRANYLEVLAQYCRDAEERLPVLRDMLKTSAGIPKAEGPRAALSPYLQSFVIQVHALKSASAGIGAEGLSEKAALLENAGRAGDFEQIEAHLEDFIGSLSSMIVQIHEGLQAPEEPEKPSAAPDKETLLRLKDALEQSDVQAINRLLKELTAEVSGKGLEFIALISDFVLISDFDEAVLQIDAYLSDQDMSSNVHVLELKGERP
jgi:signal transduction histidine kinase/CheY-like chemotaxis protein